MTRLLIVGTGPLGTTETRRFSGRSLRTWHLTQPLREAGHNVDLVVMLGSGFEPLSGEEIEVQQRVGEFKYTQLNTNIPAVVADFLQSRLDKNEYDAVVAINLEAASLVSQLQTRLPFWADICGHQMGEAQTRSRLEKQDDLLMESWRQQYKVLARADRFSACTQKQMFALIGELGAIGRLGKLTCAHPFVTVIPLAADESFLSMTAPYAERRFRGRVFPEDAFTVLWTGGYNAWTDPQALAAAVSLAMEQLPRLRFVSTGGAITGCDEATYPAFIDAMTRSGFGDRCHFLGWVEAQDLPYLYAECDLGLNMDSLNYETLLGSRFRLTNMMASGMPVLTTLGTEISEVIAEHRLGYTVKIGDIQAYADAILRAAKIPNERRQLANRARDYVRKNLSSYRGLSRSLLRWAAQPENSPDNLEKQRKKPDLLTYQEVDLNPLSAIHRQMQNGLIEELAAARAELARLEGSRFFRLRTKLHDIRGKLETRNDRTLEN